MIMFLNIPCCTSLVILLEFEDKLFFLRESVYRYDDMIYYDLL